MELDYFPFLLIIILLNRNWPPSMKMKKFENFQNKRGFMGCKWSSLNAPGTEYPLSHPSLKLEEFPSPIIDPLG